MNRFTGLLGIARRAGKLTLGGNLTEDALKKNRIKLIIISSDASYNTVRKFSDKENVPCLKSAFTKEELGLATGKSEVSVIGVTDAGFADKLEELAMIM